VSSDWLPSSKWQQVESINCEKAIGPTGMRGVSIGGALLWRDPAEEISRSLESHAAIALE
jgi:hypothetical protein